MDESDMDQNGKLKLVCQNGKLKLVCQNGKLKLVCWIKSICRLFNYFKSFNFRIDW